MKVNFTNRRVQVREFLSTGQYSLLGLHANRAFERLRSRCLSKSITITEIKRAKSLGDISDNEESQLLELLL